MVALERKLLVAWLAVAGAVLPATAIEAQANRVRNTVHNLSASGPGSIRAVSESEVCVFCHTPHGSLGDTPLWNRSLSATAYDIYQSRSLTAALGQPSGSSKLCLSCHDGTIALGNVLSRPIGITIAGGVDRLPAGSNNLGTDLADDHPISFSYASSIAGGDAELVAPQSILPPVKLDGNGELQCTSCHDAHDNSFGDFLLRSTKGGGLCTSCHQLTNWPSSSHATSGVVVTADVAGSLGADSASTAENACKSCHRSHGGAGRPWLLHLENISATCLPCHDGSVASGDVRRQLTKMSDHGIVTEGAPDPTGQPYIEGSNVSCADCHNAHQAGAAGAVSGQVAASLAGVPGVNLSGAPVTTLSGDHELCFRCHGDTGAPVEILVSRELTQPNLRLRFQPTNPSFHPVGNPGANTFVPSLLPPYTEGSIISCGSCHDADDSRKGGGSGAAGPHGSMYKPLLAKRYELADFTVESPSAYALCYGCHSRESILNDDSFGKHNEHIVEEQTPCSVCHDPHGIDSTQGTALNHGHLLNFDRSVVFPSSSGRLEFIDIGTFHGQCYLTCHNVNHDPLEY